MLFMLMTLLQSMAVAEHVTPEKALKVAQTFLSVNGAKSDELTDISRETGFSNLYVLRGLEGFVVLSADDCVRPVLGYSTINSFEVKNMPDNVREWLQGYDDQIQSLISTRAQPSAETTRLWEELKDGKGTRTDVVVDALVQTRWNQGSPFNAMCPAGCVTGCVATAMAQIMKYWDYPSHGMGSSSYAWNDTILGADFWNTTYDWDNMPNNLYSSSPAIQKQAVAELMYHCGASVEMMYGPSSSGGSSASTGMVASALVNYFNYKPTISYLYRSDVSDGIWIEMLMTEMNARRPVQYRGTNAVSGGGHSFICDGYDSDTLFHFNWGWGGMYDGFYSIDDMSPGSGGIGSGSGVYTVNQAAIFGIEPNISMAGEPTSLFAVLNGKSVSLSWEAGTDAVSYSIYRNGNPLVDEVVETQYVDDHSLYGTSTYYVRSVDANGVMSLSSNQVAITLCYQTPIVNDLDGTYDDGTLELSWTTPEWCYPEHETTSLYYTLTYSGNVVGYGGSQQMYWGHKYPASLLSSSLGKGIYKVSFYSVESGTYQLFVYKGTDEERDVPVSLLMNKPVTFSQIGWCDFELDLPIVIDGTEDIWVFIYDPEFRNLPACCSTSSEPKNGGYYSTSPSDWTGVWTSGAFLIQTFLTDGVYTYNLYDGNVVVASDIEGNSYSIVDAADDMIHHYKVTTNYYDGETFQSNRVDVAVGDVSLSSLSLDANNKMIVAENAKLSVNALACATPANLIIENGAQLICESDGVKATLKHRIEGCGSDSGKWHLVASPITESVIPTTENGLLSESYDLYLFDQSAEDEWRNYKAEPFLIENKTGYLFAAEEGANLEFAGTLMTSVEAVGLVYDENKPLAGWNLVGNPYPCNAYLGQSYYSLNSNGTRISPTLMTDAVAPCAAIWVKANEVGQMLNFSKTEQQRESNFIVVKVADEDDAVGDQVILCQNADESVSLPGFPFGERETRLYISQNGLEYAIMNVENDAAQEVEICFETGKAGKYLLSVDMENAQGYSLVLVDNLTGNRCCLQGDSLPYVFTAKPDDVPLRFKLLLNND